MLRVERLAARVTLDDPGPALDRAQTEAAAGDESWRQWVTEYRDGEALIVRLDVTLEASEENGSRFAIHVANRGVFLEKDRQPPNVEQQVGELAAKDFPVLAERLAARGHRLDQYALGQMYVHVELADDVRRSLADAESSHLRFPGHLRGADPGVAVLEGPRET